MGITQSYTKELVKAKEKTSPISSEEARASGFTSVVFAPAGSARAAGASIANETNHRPLLAECEALGRMYSQNGLRNFPRRYAKDAKQ